MSAGIKVLKIKGFKGFGNEVSIDLKGKNLVVYGENGSGKTSVMEALKILFDSSVSKIKLNDYKNIFKENSIEITINTNDGMTITLDTKVEIEKDDRGNEVETLVTSFENYTNDVKTYLEAISKSTAILSYRSLMKIYDMKTDEDFYDLFIRKIMAYYLIPPKNEKALIEELEELEKLKKDNPKARKRIESKEKSIKDEINKIFSEIKDEWNKYIRILIGDNVEVECSVEKLGSLYFKVIWNGKDVRNIMNYLNEGRLNAISLGLFLSYYKKFNRSPYKLLLLDDVVIGLDMSLRLPLLKILQDDFENEYQIIMTTFDENWFNLMKNYLDSEKWEFVRLIVKKTDGTQLPFLVGVESSDFLQKAEQYLKNGDYAAAALYVRLEFERLVLKYAERRKLKIPFKRKASELPINLVWDAVKENLPAAKILCRRIDMYVAILLNPAVHYDERPKYKNEVKYAIETVKKLRNKISKLVN